MYENNNENVRNVSNSHRQWCTRDFRNGQWDQTGDASPENRSDIRLVSNLFNYYNFIVII